MHSQFRVEFDRIIRFEHTIDPSNFFAPLFFKLLCTAQAVLLIN